MYGQQIRKNKDICPFVFMYLHFNWDGTVSPCTLDWPKKVVIGMSTQESALEIWNGKSLRDLRIAMAGGARDKINFCGSCSAPMVCVNEDLDPFKERVFATLSVTEEEKSLKGNSWLPTGGAL